MGISSDENDDELRKNVKFSLDFVLVQIFISALKNAASQRHKQNVFNDNHVEWLRATR